MQNTANLPPYVKFKTVPVEDRSKVIAEGKFGWKNVDFAEITRPGQNDTVEREVEPWLADMLKRVESGLVPAQWHEHFVKAYQLWKEGNEIPEDGTPLKMWPLVDPAQVEHLLYIKVRTVEALAQLDDSALSKVGTGAVELRNKARAWLSAATNTGATAAKLDALAVENADLKAQVAAMRAQLEAIAAKQKAPAL